MTDKDHGLCGTNSSPSAILLNKYINLCQFFIVVYFSVSKKKEVSKRGCHNLRNY